MTRFTYTAERSTGEVYKGVADARDRFDLYRIVRGDGAHIISVAEEKADNAWNFSFWSKRISSVGEYEKILFARNLGAMLAAGLPLARSLSVIERQTRNVKMSIVVASVESDVRRGDPLHVAFAKFPRVFPKLFIAMVRAGEEGGD